MGSWWALPTVDGRSSLTRLPGESDASFRRRIKADVAGRCKTCSGSGEITYGSGGLSGKAKAICPECEGSGREFVCGVCDNSDVGCPFCAKGSRILDESTNP